MLSLLCPFDSCDFADWDITARHVINAMGCRMALNGKPSPILRDGAETDESVRNWDNWDNQNVQAYGNLMLRISPDIRNLVTKEGIINTSELLD